MNLTPDEYEKLADEVTNRIDKKNEARHRQITDLLFSIQKTSDIAYGELDSDRQNLAQMAISQRGIEESLRQLVDLSKKATQKVTDAVVSQTKEVVENASQVMSDKVEPVMQRAVNKIKNGIPLGSTKPWWKFW